MRFQAWGLKPDYARGESEQRSCAFFGANNACGPVLLQTKAIF
jgi:hypothetical protein